MSDRGKQDCGCEVGADVQRRTPVRRRDPRPPEVQRHVELGEALPWLQAEPSSPPPIARGIEGNPTTDAAVLPDDSACAEWGGEGLPTRGKEAASKHARGLRSAPRTSGFHQPSGALALKASRGPGIAGRYPRRLGREAFSSEIPAAFRRMYVPQVDGATGFNSPVADTSAADALLLGEPVGLDCQQVSFQERVAAARARARFPEVGGNPIAGGFVSRNFLGALNLALSDDWLNFLARWWLTGSPLRWFGPATRGYRRYGGNHLLKSAGPNSLTFPQLVEVASCIDIALAQEDWISQYFLSRGSRVWRLGRATNRVLRFRNVAYAVWDGDEAADVTGAELTAAGAGKFYDLTKNSSLSASERTFIAERVDPPSASDFLVMLPSSPWLSGATGEAWGFLEEGFGMRPGSIGLPPPTIGCGPPDPLFTPTLQAVEGGQYLIPRRETDPGAAILLEAPWRELFEEVAPAQHFADVTRLPWVNLYSTLVHELMHAAFADIGEAEGGGGDSCAGTDPLVIAQTNDNWETTPHYLVRVAANETAEQFIFGQPLGRLTLRDCADG